MLKGDLASTPLAQVLGQLAAAEASGCLQLLSPAEDVAKIYLRGGEIYAVVAPGERPQIGARLVSGGALGPEALAEALEAQRTELQGWRLGELLVHLGYLDQHFVEAFVREQVRDSLSALLSWRQGTWKLRINERTRDDVAPPSTVADLLTDIEARRVVWATLVRTVHGPDAVPLLSAAGNADGQLEIAAEAWSLLCKVDGVRTLADLAAECGFTLYEAAQIVVSLVSAGLLEVEPAVGHEEDLALGGVGEHDTRDGDADADASRVGFDTGSAALASRIAGALTGITAPVAPVQRPAPPLEREPAGIELADLADLAASARHLEAYADDAAVQGSISRVSEALSALLGPACVGDEMFSAPRPRPVPKLEANVAVDPRRVERDRREAVRRSRDAEELAAAQAELEAARAAEQVRRDGLLPEGHVAEVVDLQERRQAEAEAARQAEESRLAEEARLVEESRLAEEEARLAEESRLAEEARLAREAAEQAEAEAARQAEAARLSEESRLAEEARLVEESRLAEEARVAEEARLAREAAEQAEEARLREQAAERSRLDEERRLQEIAVGEDRQAEDAFKAAEQAHQEAATRRLAEAEESRLAAARVALESDQRAAAAAELAAMALGSEDEPEHLQFDAATQAAAFAELSASASLDVAPPPQTVVVAPDEPAHSMNDHDWHQPARNYDDHDTDTAALMRELTSLGMDDDAPSPSVAPPSRPPAPRTVTAGAQKKRKGLFGRG